MKNMLSKIFKSGKQVNQKFMNYGPVSFVEQLFTLGRQNSAFYQCIHYYRQCAPLFSGIQLIADEVAGVEPYLYDRNSLEYKKTDALLDLLYKPNMDVTGSEFLEQIVSYFLITGNCFIVATGDANKPARELFIVPTQYVTLIPGADGFTQTITINPDYLFTETFVRKEVDGRLRFYAGEDLEIWHMREFNPLMGANNLYGMPKLMPIFYEIEQYISASIHNLSLLRRGARPSGALVAGEPLNDDQFMRLQEQMDKYYAGSQNSGRLMLLENGIDFREMSMTNKDMDFMELKKNVTVTIYNTLKIPLPLIVPDHMTMSNMDTSKLNLYDNTVIPMVNRIFSELSSFLMHRYYRNDQYCISYSPDSITALEIRRADEINKLKEIGVLTINELRARVGYEPLQGGDILFGSSSEAPIAQDTYQEDEPKVPSPKSIRQEFFEVMRSQRNHDNSKKYSDTYIEELARKYDI